MVEWFNNLSDANKIAIVVPIGIAIIGGLLGLLKWLFPKEDDPAPGEETIHQQGSAHTATTMEGDKNIVAGGDVSTGIDGDLALRQLVSISKQAGQSEEKIKNYEKKIKQLEEQLSQSQIIADTGRQQAPQPTQEAKDLASQIEDDAGPYALALKAIATGNTQGADDLLDQSQQLLDTMEEQKDRAQAKIYMARMQNASYAGRPRDALQYCDKLKTLTRDDSMIINEMAAVYYKNAQYEEAERLMQRALKIDEASLGKDHPDVGRDRNNLAQLYKATNRLKEREPLIQGVVEIPENPSLDLEQARHLHEDVIKSVLATVLDEEEACPVCANPGATHAMGVVAACLAARSMLGHIRSLRDQFNVWAGELSVEASFTKEKLDEHIQTLRNLDSELRRLTSDEIQSSGVSHNLIERVFSLLPEGRRLLREDLVAIQRDLEVRIIRDMEELLRDCPNRPNATWQGKIERMLGAKARGVKDLYLRLEAISAKIDVSIRSIKEDWDRDVQQMQQ